MCDLYAVVMIMFADYWFQPRTSMSPFNDPWDAPRSKSAPAAPEPTESVEIINVGGGKFQH